MKGMEALKPEETPPEGKKENREGEGQVVNLGDGRVLNKAEIEEKAKTEEISKLIRARYSEEELRPEAVLKTKKRSEQPRVRDIKDLGKLRPILKEGREKDKGGGGGTTKGEKIFDIDAIERWEGEGGALLPEGPRAESSPAPAPEKTPTPAEPKTTEGAWPWKEGAPIKKKGGERKEGRAEFYKHREQSRTEWESDGGALRRGPQMRGSKGPRRAPTERGEKPGKEGWTDLDFALEKKRNQLKGAITDTDRERLTAEMEKLKDQRFTPEEREANAARSKMLQESKPARPQKKLPASTVEPGLEDTTTQAKAIGISPEQLRGVARLHAQANAAEAGNAPIREEAEKKTADDLAKEQAERKRQEEVERAENERGKEEAAKNQKKREAEILRRAAEEEEKKREEEERIALGHLASRKGMPDEKAPVDEAYELLRDMESGKFNMHDPLAMQRLARIAGENGVSEEDIRGAQNFPSERLVGKVKEQLRKNITPFDAEAFLSDMESGTASLNEESWYKLTLLAHREGLDEDIIEKAHRFGDPNFIIKPLREKRTKEEGFHPPVPAGPLVVETPRREADRPVKKPFDWSFGVRGYLEKRREAARRKQEEAKQAQEFLAEKRNEALGKKKEKADKQAEKDRQYYLEQYGSEALTGKPRIKYEAFKTALEEQRADARRTSGEASLTSEEAAELQENGALFSEGEPNMRKTLGEAILTPEELAELKKNEAALILQSEAIGAKAEKAGLLERYKNFGERYRKVPLKYKIALGVGFVSAGILTGGSAYAGAAAALIMARAASGFASGAVLYAGLGGVLEKHFENRAEKGKGYTEAQKKRMRAEFAALTTAAGVLGGYAIGNLVGEYFGDHAKELPKGKGLADSGLIKPSTEFPPLQAPTEAAAAALAQALEPHTIARGETFYKIIKDNFPKIAELEPGKQANAIENILAKMDNPKSFGVSSGNLNNLKPGDIIDLEKIRHIIDTSTVRGEGIIEHAKNLDAETVERIKGWKPPAPVNHAASLPPLEHVTIEPKSWAGGVDLTSPAAGGAETARDYTKEVFTYEKGVDAAAMKYFDAPAEAVKGGLTERDVLILEEARDTYTTDVDSIFTKQKFLGLFGGERGIASKAWLAVKEMPVEHIEAGEASDDQVYELKRLINELAREADATPTEGEKVEHYLKRVIFTLTRTNRLMSD